jgi:kynurenine formamidase
MKNATIKFPLVIFVLLVLGCSQDTPKFNNTWIDLTYSFDSTSLYWPNNPTGFQHVKDFAGVNMMGFYYSSFSLKAPEHGGTHLDAPIHFAENKLTADKLPLDKLTGNAIIVDVSEKALQNRDYLISVEDLLEWEKRNSKIQDSVIVLFRTGYGQFYPDRKKYFGTDELGQEAIPGLHFPGISKEACEWLVQTKTIKAVGIDTPSLDYGQSTDFMAHRVLLGNNIPGFENVANLNLLPETGTYIVALPMKIGQGSGAPLRIIANILQAEN